MPAANSILWLFGSIATPIFQDKPAVHFSLHLEHRTVCHGRNHRREQAGTAPDVVIPARAIHLPELRRWIHRGASEEAGSWRRRASEEAGWGGLLHPSTCRTQVVTAFGAVEVVAAALMEAIATAHVAIHALVVRRRQCTFFLSRHSVALFARRLTTPSSWYREGVNNWRREKAGSWRRCASEEGGSWRRRTSDEAGSWRRRASEEASSWRRRASEEAGSWRRRASEEAGSWRRRTSEEGGS